MRKYITTEVNLHSHTIQRALECSWHFAFNLAVEHSCPELVRFISESWLHDDAYALANHYWSLHKAYEETLDRGRSITMRKAAQVVYNACTEPEVIGLRTLCHKGLGKSVICEAFDYYKASRAAELTPRSKLLILNGAVAYSESLKIPRWTSYCTPIRNFSSNFQRHVSAT